jgi:DNA-binding transcriptional MocR family regulator
VPEQYQVSGKSAEAISESIESGIRQGTIDIGAHLPTIRMLAEILEVSPATVSKAYTHLRHRGLIEANGRRGTRVRHRPAVATPRSGLQLSGPADLVDLSDGEPDTAALPPLNVDICWVADRLGAPVGYAQAGAMPELTDAARPRLAHDGVPMANAAITVTSGTLDAIERLLTVHLRPGDAVAVEDPGWVNLFDLLAALGLRVVPMAVDDEGPTPAAMRAALAAGVRAVVVTSRAQNPTGAAVSARRADELREVLGGRSGVLIVEDDHAAELARVPLHCIGPVTGTWAFVRSASKPFGPDLRIAVLAGDEATVARVVGRMRIGSGWVSTILQRLLLRLWQDDEVTARVAEAAGRYEHRRHGLLDALQAHGVKAQGRTGINVWVRVPDEARAVGVLRDAGYAVAPGSLFRIEAPPGIRVTVSRLTDEHIAPLSAAIAGAAQPAGVATPSR